MKMISALARMFVLAVSLAATATYADVLLDVSGALVAGNPTQLGRLSRNALQQDWAGSESFPGVINPASTYHYTTYTVNVGATPYLQIEFDSTSANTFVSAYLTSYAPNSAGAPNYGFDTNWLGDAGRSGSFFGTDPVFLNVVAPMSSVLVIVVAETTPNAGLGAPYNLLVEGFTDTSFTNTTLAGSVTLTSNNNPAAAGSSITLTATVTGTSPPAGSVKFLDGGVIIPGCAAVALPGGSATTKTANCVTMLAPGSHDLIAIYMPIARGGTPTTSTPLVQVVNPKLTTTTTLASTPNPSTSAQVIAFTATVTGSVSPTGTVAFVDTTAAATIAGCGAVPLVGSGLSKTATCNSKLAAGVRNINANYSGDAASAASTGSVTQTVNACVGRGC
ncbi:MAG: Ig-like domain repeat protein [Casimicrobiaceae bacterium]